MNSTILSVRRREFLQNISGAGICVACGGLSSVIFSACESPTEPERPDSGIPLIEGEAKISIPDETPLQSTGGSVKKRFSAINGGNTVVIIVRLSESSFAAFNASCTHQGTIVNLPSNGVMICPSHGSKFTATTGAVVQGPAASPLATFRTSYNQADNVLTIG